jgi:hypothetical protein
VSSDIRSMHTLICAIDLRDCIPVRFPCSICCTVSRCCSHILSIFQRHPPTSDQREEHGATVPHATRHSASVRADASAWYVDGWLATLMPSTTSADIGTVRTTITQITCTASTACQVTDGTMAMISGRNAEKRNTCFNRFVRQYINIVSKFMIYSL